LLPESKPPDGWGEAEEQENDQPWVGDEAKLAEDCKRFQALVAHWHAPHRRKDQVEHCVNVMEQLKDALVRESVSCAEQRPMLLAALGHDLYEDSKIPPGKIIEEYGPDVHQLIQTLTEGPEGVHAYVDQVASGPEESRLIKLCDGIDNYGGLVEKGFVKKDPAYWLWMVRRHMEPIFNRLETIPFPERGQVAERDADSEEKTILGVRGGLA
jgi:hypothetical protein